MIGIYKENSLNGPLVGKHVSGKYCGVPFSGRIFSHCEDGAGIDLWSPITINTVHTGKSKRFGVWVDAEDLKDLVFE